MKFLHFIWFIVLATLAFSFVSCEKDKDEETVVNYNTKLLPEKMVRTMANNPAHKGTYEFSYDGKKLTKCSSLMKWGDDAIITTYEISYENDKVSHLKKSILDCNSIVRNISFTYVKDTVFAKYESSSATSSWTVKYLINKQGYLLSRYDIKCTYSDTNLTEEIQKNEKEVATYHITYTYDDKIGMFRNVDIPQWFIATQMRDIPLRDAVFFSKNNNVTYTEFLAHDNYSFQGSYDKFDYKEYIEDFPSIIEHEEKFSIYKNSYTYTITYKEAE